MSASKQYIWTIHRIYKYALLILQRSIVATEIVNEEFNRRYVLNKPRQALNQPEFYKDKLLVQKGEIIDRDVYRQIELLGMLTNKASYKPILGVILFVVLTMWVIICTNNRKKEKTIKNSKNLIVVAFSVILSVLMMKVIQSSCL